MGSKMLLNPEFFKNGTILKFNKAIKGKLLFIISCIIIKKIGDKIYEIEICINHLKEKMHTKERYKVDLKLLKPYTKRSLEKFKRKPVINSGKIQDSKNYNNLSDGNLSYFDEYSLNSVFDNSGNSYIKDEWKF